VSKTPDSQKRRKTSLASPETLFEDWQSYHQMHAAVLLPLLPLIEQALMQALQHSSITTTEVPPQRITQTFLDSVFGRECSKEVDEAEHEHEHEHEHEAEHEDEHSCTSSSSSFSISNWDDSCTQVLTSVSTVAVLRTLIQATPIECNSTVVTSTVAAVAGLMHLRLGISYVAICCLLLRQKRYARSLRRSAIRWLTKFVELHYQLVVKGLDATTIRETHTPTAMIADLPNVCCFIDATYHYGEESLDRKLHQALYCTYKSRPLTKWMVICAPDGTLLHLDGPYTGSTTDDAIFQAMLADDANAFTIWLRTLPPDAVLGLDSGFPQAQQALRNADIALSVCFPIRVRTDSSVPIEPASNSDPTVNFAPKDKRKAKSKSQSAALSQDEAKRTRLLTRWRGVVERLNAQLKMHLLLSMPFPNRELASAELYWRTAGILCNMFYQKSLAVLNAEFR
jgi:hypothetical protein